MTTEPNTLEPGTRERLLQAAGEVFADRGFRDATIRDICGAAGVNVAAVNYHFGDKEGLYREVFRVTAVDALARYPIGGGVGMDAPVEERFRAFVRTYLDRLLDTGRPAWHGKLISREMVEPTAVLDELVEGFVRPQYERIRSIVAELLGPAATDDRVRLCVGSVVGQCLFYKLCRPVIGRIMPEQGYDAAGRAGLAAHISEFSLGAIERLRREGGGA